MNPEKDEIEQRSVEAGGVFTLQDDGREKGWGWGRESVILYIILYVSKEQSLPGCDYHEEEL